MKPRETGLLLAALLFPCFAAARAQQPPPAGDGGGSGSPVAGTEKKEPAGGGAKLLDQNYVLAAANSGVVTVRDVMIEWRLKRRRDADPERVLPPDADGRRALAKEVVTDRLWLAHARAIPTYSEIVTARILDEEAKDRFGSLYEDRSVPDDERELMRTKAEVGIAMQLVLFNDPEFKRCQDARPSDIKRWWDAHPEQHRIGTQVKLGRVLLSRENARELYGEEAESLVLKLRQRAAELSSLEAAAKELAPGSYQADREYDVERETGLREDVLAFAKNALPGELSPPVSGQTSVMLFTVLSRKEGRDVPYEEASAYIKKQLENRRCQIRAEEYFVLRILPEAFYGPADLFDEEIERFIPGYRERRARMKAAASAQR